MSPSNKPTRETKAKKIPVAAELLREIARDHFDALANRMRDVADAMDKSGTPVIEVLHWRMVRRLIERAYKVVGAAESTVKSRRGSSAVGDALETLRLSTLESALGQVPMNKRRRATKQDETQ